MTSPRLITGLRDIADAYAMALCDVWGVLHNGHAAFPAAADALMAFRSTGKAVVLVSNAPRPAEQVAMQLDRLAFPRQAWDAIVTSGDATRSQIVAHAGKKLFHLGPARDRPLFEGIAAHFSDETEAEVVVCTGLFDDTIERAETYRPMLERLLRRQVPMICANPDLVVERGGLIIDCAGAVADLYERMGSRVTFCGKPHRPIYDMAFDKAERLLLRKIAPQETLAIGDSVRTDLSGAAAIGCGALFVAGGIHAEDLKSAQGHLDAGRLAQFFNGQAVTPDAVLLHLVW